VSFVSTLSDLYSTASRFLGDSTRRMVGEGANGIVHRLPAASEESGHDRVQGRIGLCLRILTCLDKGFREQGEVPGLLTCLVSSASTHVLAPACLLHDA
jgi:hypothetical protein